MIDRGQRYSRYYLLCTGLKCVWSSGRASVVGVSVCVDEGDGTKAFKGSRDTAFHIHSGRHSGEDEVWMISTGHHLVLWQSVSQ